MFVFLSSRLKMKDINGLGKLVFNTKASNQQLEVFHQFSQSSFWDLLLLRATCLEMIPYHRKLSGLQVILSETETILESLGDLLQALLEPAESPGSKKSKTVKLPRRVFQALDVKDMYWKPKSCSESSFQDQVLLGLADPTEPEANTEKREGARSFSLVKFLTGPFR